MIPLLWMAFVALGYSGGGNLLPAGLPQACEVLEQQCQQPRRHSRCITQDVCAEKWSEY